jgi:hypothetical protein
MISNRSAFGMIPPRVDLDTAFLGIQPELYNNLFPLQYF